MIPSSRCPTPEECADDGCAGQCTDSLLAEALRAINAISPMSPIRTTVVCGEAGFVSVVAQMKANGMRLACQSNTGLSAGSWRLTFLPESAFTNEPQPAGRVTAAQVDGDLEPRGPTKSGVEPLNVGDEHALAAWIARCQDGPPRCRKAPINLKDLVKSL